MKHKYPIFIILTVLFATAFNSAGYSQPLETDWRVTALNEPEPGYMKFDCLELIGFFAMDNYGSRLFRDTSHFVYYNPLNDGGWMTLGDKYYIFDKNLKLTDSIAFIPGLRADFHEFIQLRNGHYLLLYVEEYVKDMSAVVPGGKPNATIYSDVLIETDPSGAIYWEWRAKDHFNITDMAEESELLQNTIDFSHANSFCEDSVGNIYISFRHLDEITKVNKSSGQIMWRFGGSKCKNNQFNILNDEINGFKGFSHQHTVTALPNGNILLYDNGNLKPQQYSRAVEYQLDEINKTALKVWEYTGSPLSFSVALGSAFRLPGGNTLINWATGKITEVKPDGSVALELSAAGGKTVYRARKTTIGMNAVTQKVNYTGSYSFNDDNNTTGVMLSVNSLQGSGYISVTKHEYAPLAANYQDTTYNYIYPARWVISKRDISGFSAKFRLDAAILHGVRNPSKLKVYGRSKETVGLFKEVASVYNDATGYLEANISESGEYVLGVFELGPPTLNTPANEKTTVSLSPSFSWTALGATKCRLQVAANANFANLIVDATVNGVSDYAASGLSYDTKYYWRVQSLNNFETSEWSEIRSFRTELQGSELLAPENKIIGVKAGDLAKWKAAPGATRYRMQIATKNDFTGIVSDVSEIEGTQVQIPNLFHNTKYHWRIKAYRGTDSSRWSASREFTTTIEAPRLSSPDSNAVNVPLAGQFLWSSVKGAEGYKLQVSLTEDFSDLIIDVKNIKVTAYEYSALNYNTQYYWRVKSFRSTDESEWSTAGGFFTLLEAPKLKIPQQDAIVKVYDIMLWWEAPEGAKRYKLQLSKSPTFADTLFSLSSIYYPAFTLSEAPANSQLYWRVLAYDNAKTSDWSEVGAFSTLGAPGLAPPELLSPANDDETDDFGVLNWSKISRVNMSRVQISEKPDFSTLLVDSARYFFNFYQFSKLRPATRYYWRIKGYSYYDSSAWSGTRSFTTRALSAVKLISPAPDQALVTLPVKFSWEPASGATNYEIEISLDSNFASITAGAKSLNSAEWILEELERFTHYHWRVRAGKDGSFGPWSADRSFTTEPLASMAPPNLAFPYNFQGSAPIEGFLKWSPVPGASKYRVVISNDYEFENLTLKMLDPVDTLAHYTGLEYNNWYFWRVAAINDNAQSDWSEPHAFLTELKAPTLLSPENDEVDVKVEGLLVWGDLPDVDKYFIQISTDSLFKSYSAIGMEFEPQYHFSLSPDSLYYWRILSVNPWNYSQWSQVYKFTTSKDMGAGDYNPGKTAYLYPNPAVDFVWISADKYLGKRYDIFDLAGRPVAGGLVVSQKLDVTSLTAGAYYAQIEGDIFMLIKN